MQSAREQSLDVPVPRMREQRVRQRTFEQFAGMPALQVVEEPLFSQDTVQQCFVDKNIDTTVAKSVGEARPPGIAKYRGHDRIRIRSVLWGQRSKDRVQQRFVE